MREVVLHTHMCESTLTHSHYKTHDYPKIGNVIFIMLMLYLSLHTCTNHMAGMFAFSSAVVSCIYHSIYHLGMSGKTSQLLALTLFNLSKTKFECRSEILATARYIQLLSASTVLGAAGCLSCPEIPKQSLLKWKEERKGHSGTELVMRMSGSHTSYLWETFLM